MSAVLAAAFRDHGAAEKVRTRLVMDGFPTDRVELTSCQELGDAKLVPDGSIEDKLTHYFGQLFPADSGPAPAPLRRLEKAVLSGNAVIAVHPRGQVETDRAVEILNQAEPIDFAAQDLDKQALEGAAAEQESSALSWIGRVMVAPGRRPD